MKAGDNTSYRAVQMVEGQRLGGIIIARSMITDHLCTTYMKALQLAAANIADCNDEQKQA